VADALMAMEIDAAAVLRALEQAPAAVEARLLPVAKLTAERIDAEASRRVLVATGKTQTGITVEPLEKGSGYAVVANRNPFPNVPIWLEHGTEHMIAHPFFDIAADLERGPHLRLMREAADDALKGLG